MPRQNDGTELVRKLTAIDLYRIASPDELLVIGFEDYLDSGALVVIDGLLSTEDDACGVVRDFLRSESANPAIASDEVRPGDSIPNRLTSRGMPCSAGPSIRKSAAGSPLPVSLGRMPQ